MTTQDPTAAREAMIRRQRAQSLGLRADELPETRDDGIAGARARMIERQRRTSLGLPAEAPRADAAPSGEKSLGELFGPQTIDRIAKDVLAATGTPPAREPAPQPFAGGLPPEVETARQKMLDKLAESRRTDGPAPTVRTVRTDAGTFAGNVRFAGAGEGGSL